MQYGESMLQRSRGTSYYTGVYGVPWIGGNVSLSYAGLQFHMDRDVLVTSLAYTRAQ